MFRIFPDSICHISAHIWDIEKFFSAFNFPWIVLSKTKEKIGRFKSLKFTYEWRQQMWRHKLTFGVILSAILIGLMFCIFRPSLVGKELKQAKLFQINRNCHLLISPLGGGLAPPWMENSTSTALKHLFPVDPWAKFKRRIFSPLLSSFMSGKSRRLMIYWWLTSQGDGQTIARSPFERA